MLYSMILLTLLGRISASVGVDMNELVYGRGRVSTSNYKVTKSTHPGIKEGMMLTKIRISLLEYSMGHVASISMDGRVHWIKNHVNKPIVKKDTEARIRVEEIINAIKQVITKTNGDTDTADWGVCANTITDRDASAELFFKYGFEGEQWRRYETFRVLDFPAQKVGSMDITGNKLTLYQYEGSVRTNGKIFLIQEAHQINSMGTIMRTWQWDQGTRMWVLRKYGDETQSESSGSLKELLSACVANNPDASYRIPVPKKAESKFICKTRRRRLLAKQRFRDISRRLNAGHA